MLNKNEMNGKANAADVDVDLLVAVSEKCWMESGTA